MTMAISPSPQFVFKLSKYCNLRCGYCYEFPHLGDKRRMSLDQIRAAFQNIKNSIDKLQIERAQFIWHGGEPLLIPLDYYRQIDRLQKEIFGAEFKFKNAVQTNLTILTDRHIAFLESGFFDDIGVSFDVHGEQRLDSQGRSHADTVRSHMKKLMDRGINFAAIAVLARDTLPDIRQTYRFFDGLGIRHRVLAYYRSVGSEQAERHGLEFDELVAAHRALFDEWLASDRATPVEPIRDHVRYAVQCITGFRSDRYERSKSERIFMVDVNGDVFNPIEAYEREFCYGNLFDMPFCEIAESEARARSVALTDQRTELFCRSCEYFGSCPGIFVANATDIERKMLETKGCPVRASLDHILNVFSRTGLHDFVLESQQATGGDLAEDNPVLSVA
jgi:uncharacterized protein